MTSRVPLAGRLAQRPDAVLTSSVAIGPAETSFHLVAAAPEQEPIESVERTVAPPSSRHQPFTRTVPVPNFAVNLPAAVGTGQGGALGVTLGSIDNTLNLALRLSALESSGLVRIVSAPKVMVLDNKEARINQGTLIPFAQVSALGATPSEQERLRSSVLPTSWPAFSLPALASRPEATRERMLRVRPTLPRRTA